MPAFIRDNIPAVIWDGISWANSKIDDQLLPALSNIDQKLSEVNAVLESHRQTAASLIDELAHPGDLLSRIDQLEESARLLQEGKIDDITSRLYEKETDKYLEDDAAIIEEFELIDKAMEAPIPEPSFLSLEDIPRHDIVAPERIGAETWFVGDY